MPFKVHQTPNSRRIYIIHMYFMSIEAYLYATVTVILEVHVVTEITNSYGIIKTDLAFAIRVVCSLAWYIFIRILIHEWYQATKAQLIYSLQYLSD